MLCFGRQGQIRGDGRGGADIRIEAGAAPARSCGAFAPKRDLAGLAPVLARSGSLEARLAVTKQDVRRAQKLRYRVFFDEGGAVPDPTARLIRRDVCRFDSVCDHLIVVDKTLAYRDGSPKFVGVYRLLRQDVAEREFRLLQLVRIRRRGADRAAADDPVPRGRPRLHRAKSHRGKHVLELLWRGLWAYARHHRMDAMIGCASLPGADAAVHAGAIRALAAGGGDPAWRVAPLPERAGASGESEPRRSTLAR